MWFWRYLWLARPTAFGPVARWHIKQKHSKGKPVHLMTGRSEKKPWVPNTPSRVLLQCPNFPQASLPEVPLPPNCAAGWGPRLQRVNWGALILNHSTFHNREPLDKTIGRLDRTFPSLDLWKIYSSY